MISLGFVARSTILAQASERAATPGQDKKCEFIDD